MTASVSPHRPRSRTLRLWLFIGTAVAALAIVPAAIMGMMSVMATDAGVNSTIYLFIAVMMTFPLAIVLCPVGAWIAWAMRWERLSWVLLFLPFAWVIIIIGLFVTGFGDPHPL